MPLNKEKLFFIGSVLAQFAVLAGMIFFYQSIVIGGTEVILKTVPVYPRDNLRGQYFALRYDISALDLTLYPYGKSITPNNVIYVKLAGGSGNIWQAAGTSLEKPVSGAFIKGTVVNISGSMVNIKYGIESYFADPERAVALEREARRGVLLMRVVVDDDGNGVVRGAFEGNGASSLVLGNPQARSRDAKRLSDIAQYRVALELYFDQNSSYPESLQDISPHISSLPRDPATGMNYYYQFCGPNSYHLGADLEDQTNTTLQSDKDIAMLCPEDKVHGADNLSCDGITPGKFCYDVAEGEPTVVPASALPPKVTVTFPNAAQIFIVNQGVSIRWNAQGLSAGAKFQVAVLDEATKKVVISWDLDGSRRNHDVSLVSVTFPPNKFYRAKVSLKDSAGKIISSDESDKAFGIS